MKPIIEPLCTDERDREIITYPPTMTRNLTFVTGAVSISPSITISSGTPVWAVQESDGKVYLYYTASFTHNRVAAGNYRVELCNTAELCCLTTAINFNTLGIVSSFFDLQIHSFKNLTDLYLYGNGFTDDLTPWVIDPALTDCRLYSNNFKAGPTYPVRTSDLRDFTIHDNGLSQEAVDKLTLMFYNNRMHMTRLTPTINVSGTNAAPSGSYLDEDPPVTGKGRIFELMNDPELEGFNKHVWYYTP